MSRGPKSRPWVRVVIMALGIPGIAGCFGVSQEHYFAVADLNSPDRELTFYRVKISATSRLTTSQYTSGFYDADALHQLFGQVKNVGAVTPPPAEMPTPNNGTPPPAPSVTASAATVKTRTTTSSSPSAGSLQIECDRFRNCRLAGGANDRFTVIYGAKADAVAQQIQSFADSEGAGKQIAALLAASTSAEVFERTAAADQSLDQAKKSAAALAKELRAFAEQLGGAPVSAAANGDAARLILLQAAQQATKRAGSITTFTATPLDTGFTQAKAAYEVLSR